MLINMGPSQVMLAVKNLSATAGAVRHTGSALGLGTSSGGGHGNPLHYCLENPTGRGAWWATGHRVTKSWTQLKWLSTIIINIFFNDWKGIQTQRVNLQFYQLQQNPNRRLLITVIKTKHLKQVEINDVYKNKGKPDKRLVGNEQEKSAERQLSRIERKVSHRISIPQEDIFRKQRWAVPLLRWLVVLFPTPPTKCNNNNKPSGHCIWSRHKKAGKGGEKKTNSQFQSPRNDMAVSFLVFFLLHIFPTWSRRSHQPGNTNKSRERCHSESFWRRVKKSEIRNGNFHPCWVITNHTPTSQHQWGSKEGPGLPPPNPVVKKHPCIFC